MEETTRLKIEITRLNQIINNLNELIGILKAENTFLKNKIDIKKSNDTNADFEKGAEFSLDTIADFEKGTKPSFNTNSEIENGDKPSNDTIVDFDNGIKPSLNTIPDFEKGIKQNFNANANVDSGIKSNPGSSNIVSNRIIEINSVTQSYLMWELRKILPQSTKEMAAFRMAAELLFINNNGSASYNDLRKITMLSKPGFAKHAPKLKRRGLIYRESHKKYKLTQLSKELINKTFPA